MKKIIVLILCTVLASILLGQVPQSFSYQAVARNLSGEVLSNQSISFRISILSASPSGQPMYTETHNSSTNEFGLVNLEIGRGQVISGDFSAINWGENDSFIQVEMDETGGALYQLMGTSQLLSVPYALHAETVAVPGKSLAYPQGISGDFVNLVLSPNHYYTVPVGFNLYITSLNNNSLEYHPTSGGLVYPSDGQGHVFPENTTINFDSNYVGVVDTIGFTGLLMPTSNEIQPLLLELNNLGLNYTVPNGEKLIIKSGAGQGIPLLIDGIPYYNSMGLWVVPSNSTVSADTPNNRISLNSVGYTGYLINE